jgi:hypothetical protein
MRFAHLSRPDGQVQPEDRHDSWGNMGSALMLAIAMLAGCAFLLFGLPSVAQWVRRRRRRHRD